LKPLFDKMRVQDTDFLQCNASLAEEVRSTFCHIDEIEKELKKAAKAIQTASGLTSKHRNRLQQLTDDTRVSE